VDGGQLHRLGRRLIELSRAATAESGDPAMTPGEVAVLEDALTHADSSVSDISARTGFVQSHISTSVARLKRRGLVDTASDPGDGRRTHVTVTDVAERAITARAGRNVEDALATAITDRAKARRVSALLDELAHLLL